MFDRLYREGGRQKNSMRMETVESPVTNRRERRLLSPPQPFSRTTRSNLAYPPSKKPPLDAHSIVISPVHPPHPIGLPSSSLRKSHIEWRSASPLPRSHTEGVAATSVFYPPRIRRRRKEETEKAPDVMNKAQKSSICGEATKTWENITAKLGQLDHKDAINESLNELIMQLIEEQPSTPTDAFVSENVASWKFLISLLAEETYTSTNVAQVQGLNDRLLPDHTCKWLHHSGPRAKATEVYRSIKPVHQNLQDKEFESVVIFDPICANAILRDHDTYYSSSPNLTTVVDQVIDSAFPADSPPFEAQLNSSSSPNKINTDCINMPFKGDRNEKEIPTSTSSPTHADVSVSKITSEHELKKDQEGDSKSNGLDSLADQVIVANAALMRSCMEVIEPYGENGRLMDSTDLMVISPLSNNFSTERRSESGEQDSFIDESLVSLNSTSEHLFQEHVGLLKENKAHLNESVERERNEEPHRGLPQNQASNTECFDQSSTHKPLHQGKMKVSEFSMSKEEAYQNRCVRQAILSKSNFARLSTELENEETGEVCKVERVSKFPGADSALKALNEKEKQSKCASDISSFMAADVRLIAVPKVTVYFFIYRLRRNSWTVGLSSHNFDVSHGRH